MGLFKKDSATIKTTLHINARLQPEHRVSYYEDHLKGIFKKEKIGSVTGGNSTFFNDGGIASCDVYIDCYDDKITRLIELLHYIPIAKGSRLVVFRPDGKVDREYPLGELEGMGIYLDGVGLPKEVYKKCDINYVVDEVFKLLETPPIIYSYWQGPKETALYFYSGSFSAMRKKINDLLATYPLCQGCRVTQVS